MGTLTIAVAAALAVATSPPEADGWHRLGDGMETNVSGLALLDDGHTALIARDNKDPGENRVSAVSFGQDGAPRLQPLQWRGEEPQDVEAIDAVPGRPDTYALVTSTGDGIVVALEGGTATVTDTFALPGRAEDADFEGLGLAQLQGGTVAVWADRGQAEEPATLRAAPLDPATMTFGTPATMEFTAADLPDDARDVSDVKIGGDGRLLVTSAWEEGDDGPFDGALYQPGSVALTAQGATFTPVADPRPLALFDGQKVEAVACTATACVVGADNENVGGALRTVPAAELGAG